MTIGYPGTANPIPLRQVSTQETCEKFAFPQRAAGSLMFAAKHIPTATFRAHYQESARINSIGFAWTTRAPRRIIGYLPEEIL